MTDIHPHDYAEVLKMARPEDEVIAAGSVEEMLAQLKSGELGQPGARLLRIEGHDFPIGGRALTSLVESWSVGES